MTLYGGWEEADISAHKLQVYDGSNLIYTKYLFADDEIVLSNVNGVSSETKFYSDASFANEKENFFQEKRFAGSYFGMKTALPELENCRFSPFVHWKNPL